MAKEVGESLPLGLKYTTPSAQAKSGQPGKLALLQRPWLLDGLVLAFFFALSLIYLIPLTGNLAESAINEGDDLQQMWSMGWVIHALTHDVSQLFNGNIFYPYPNTLAFSDHLIIQAILAFPIVQFTNNLVLGYNLAMVFAFAMSGWGMYLLVKDMSGSRSAGLFSGLIFAFAAYKFGRLSQLNLLSTEWIPFCFLFLRRLLLSSKYQVPSSKSELGSRKSESLPDSPNSIVNPINSQLATRNFLVPPDNQQPTTNNPSNNQQLATNNFYAFAFAFFFVLNALSSTYYLMFILPLLGLYFVFFHVAQRQWPRPVLILQLGLALGLAFIVLLPTFLPYLQVSSEQAAERTPREVEQFSANYRFYFGLSERNILWGNILSRFSGSGGERQLFPGALAILFALLAVAAPLVSWLWRKKRQPKFSAPSQPQSLEPTAQILERDKRWQPYIFVGLGLFALLMSFGFVLKVKGLEIPMPYRLFYDYVPGWRGLRAAMRYGVFVLFAVAILAGLGLNSVQLIIGNLLLKNNRRIVDSNRQPTTDNLSNRAEVGSIKSEATRNSVFSNNQQLTTNNFLLPALLLLAAFMEYRGEVTRINPAVLSKPPEVYRWLAAPERSGVVLELPMAKPPDMPSIRDYFSTFNWQPTIGGQTGYMPPVYNDLYALSQDITSKEALATFQGVGVRWLIVHLDDENTPLPPEAWQKLEPKLNSNKAIKLVQDFPKDKIKVYELAPDAWMQKLVDTLPAKAEVIVSDYRRNQPANIELIETLLRRNNHQIYGNDRAGYRFLSAAPTGRPVSYGLFSADEDPRPYGFNLDEVSWSGQNLKFYSRKVAPAAAYDLSRDPKLSEFSNLKNVLELEVNKNELKFNGKSVGSGNDWGSGPASVKLQLSSFSPQTLKLKQVGQIKNLEIAAGLSTLAIGPFNPGDKFSLEPASGATLYLNRVELGAGDEQSAPAAVPEAALLLATTHQQDNHLITALDLYAPVSGQGEANNYLLSLDIYRRPWGTHPGGHFGVWSVALTGSGQSHRLEFDFDPLAKTTTVSLDGAKLDVGADVIKPGDGDWATFIALRRANPKNPKDFELVGVSRLYEFNLSGALLREVNVLPARQQLYKPPLKY